MTCLKNNFKTTFLCCSTCSFGKKLSVIKNKKENNELVNIIKSGIIDSKTKIKKMLEEEIDNEKPDKILKIV